MATIQEDPGLDQILDPRLDSVLQEAFGRPVGGARRSYEDLTERQVLSRRQRPVDGRETQC